MREPLNPKNSESTFCSINKMNHWRSHVQRLLHDDSRYPDGWSLSRVDPTKALSALSALTCLAIEPGWKWITFQYMSSGDGNTVTFAVPKQEMDQTGNWLDHLRNSPHSVWVYARDGTVLPGAAWHFMDTVIGDGSPDSFAQASLLLREIGAIGGYWHGAGWNVCKILQNEWPEETDPDWKWKEGCELPVNVNPLVFIEENVARCRMYTQSDMGGRCISLVEDIYFGSSMRPESVSRVIATSKNGGWFP